MPSVDFEIPHQLTVADARARLGRITGKLEEEYSAMCRWDGERRLLVSRKGLEATIEVEEARVRVGMRVGLLMAPLANRIRSGVARELTVLLA